MEPPQFTMPDQPAQPEQPSPLPPDNYQPPKSTEHHHARNPLAVMQPGEQVICEIKRHPIGILGVYLTSGIVLVILALVALVVVPGVMGDDNRQQGMVLGAIAFFVVAALVLAFVFVANKVYWGNSWVVTSDSITQVTQTSLFSKQSSQLSLGNLEDVSSEKNGILAQMFNFGVLKAETAGERSKFVFMYCPNPNYYAQKILAAREQFEQVHHGGKQEPYVAPASPMPNAPAWTPASAPAAVPLAEQQWPEPQTAAQQSPQPRPSEPPQYQVGQTPPDFSAAPQVSQAPVFPDQPPSAAPPANSDTNQAYDTSPPDSNLG